MRVITSSLQNVLDLEQQHRPEKYVPKPKDKMLKKKDK